MRTAVALLAMCLSASAAAVLAQQISAPGAQTSQGAQQPARDTPAQQQNAVPQPTGRISGRVLATDNGRPVKRARVSLSAAELPEGRGLLTDDNGAFDFSELPAGRYTMSVSKSGFVSLSYGQRRPLQAGTPLQLADGQQIKGIDFRLPRGSVIAGHVYDEDGDPMPGIMVRVMRYQYMQGDRRLNPAGTAQTDDKGGYRIWGLMPGDYYVDAQARLNFGAFGGGRGGGGRGGPPGGGGGIAGAVGRIAGPNVASLFGQDDDQKAYAPTYYPGVTSVNEARPITLGLSQESVDNDFGLQLIHVARVAGRITNPDGSPATSGSVTLVHDNAVERSAQFGMNYSGRIQWDGSFTLANVPPGRYLLRARGDDMEFPQFATQPVTVGGGDLGDLTVILSDGATISGVVAFPSGPTQLPDVSQMRIAAPSTEMQIGNPSQARVEKDGTFLIVALPPGPHLIRPSNGGGMRGWTLKSVTYEGRDVTDRPIDIRSGQKVENVVLTFTDKVTEINGTLTSDRGVPAPDYTVLAFSTDNSLWRAQSRQIQTARPDQTGQYRIRGLPAGDYYVVTVDPGEQGEWFEPAYLDQHRLGASHVSLGDGDTKTQDFKIRSQP